MATVITFNPTNTANYNRVPLVLTYTEDGGLPANTVTVTGRIWRNGEVHSLPGFYASPSYPTEKRFDSTAFGLREGQTYTAEYTFTRRADADGSIMEQITGVVSFTTRRSPSRGTGGVIVYMAHNAANDSGNGSISQPKKTFTGAAAVSGMREIVMLNGTYTALNWESTSEVGISGKSGSSSSYNVLRAETPGSVVVSGARAMNGLTWTAYNPGTGVVPRVYKCDFSAYMDTSASPKRAPRYIRRKGASGINDGKVAFLFTSNSLTVDDGNHPAIASGTDLSFGVTYKWSTNELFLRRGQDEPDSAPGNNEYECSEWHYGLHFQNCSYWIIEGIEWEMFGGLRYDGSNDIGPGLLGAFPGVTGPFRITYTTGLPVSNIVIRNCVFDLCRLRIDGTGGDISGITIEDCSFVCADQWASHIVGVTAVTISNSYARFHNTPNDDTAILCQGAHRIVVRRCTFIGGADIINFLDAGGDYSDIYDCTLTHASDDAISLDAGNGGRNTAIWNVTVDGALRFCSTGPYNLGPLFCVNNTLVDPLATWAKCGSNGAEEGPGHKIIVNCEVLISGTIDNHFIDGACWTGTTHRNTIVYNSVFQYHSDATGADGAYYIDEGVDASAHHEPPGVKFYHCAFYATNLQPSPFVWENVGYSTFSAMLAAAPDDELEGVNLTFGVNPFPNGNDGPVNSLIPASASLPGITDAIADEDGEPYRTQPMPVGRRAGFTLESGTRLSQRKRKQWRLA